MTASDSKSVPLAEDVPQGLKPGSLSGQGGPLRLAALAQSGLIPEAVPFPISSKGTADIKQVVKQKYGEAALRVTSGGNSCRGAAPGTGCSDPITTNLYDAF